MLDAGGGGEAGLGGRQGGGHVSVIEIERFNICTIYLYSHHLPFPLSSSLRPSYRVPLSDTTFEHETGNASEEERYVLIIDFWHPELTPVERAALREFYDLRNTFEGRTGGGGVGEGRPPPMEKRREKNGGWLAGLFGG